MARQVPTLELKRTGKTWSVKILGCIAVTGVSSERAALQFCLEWLAMTQKTFDIRQERREALDLALKDRLRGLGKKQ